MLAIKQGEGQVGRMACFTGEYLSRQHQSIQDRSIELFNTDSALMQLLCTPSQLMVPTGSLLSAGLFSLIPCCSCNHTLSE